MSRELQTIQRELDKWELDHLREHAAQLATELEAARQQIEDLQNELVSADARADMFQAIADSMNVPIGITRDGFVGVLQ